MVSFVLTVLGDDRPGLVDSLSGVVTAHGGNWERSQMARLGGKFAGVVQVSVPSASATELQAALAALGDEGLLQVRVDLAGAAPVATGTRFVLSLVGTDRPGLVHSVSSALAEIGASIEELDTATSDAPMSGGPLFEATAAVVLPEGVSIESVRDTLEALADHLMVDIDLVS
ncbi:MAG: ACT domain-containing protein [Actinomycetota bacterium]|nr:ACT domain-containing protein [Actinomycetota bacterium]